MPEERIVRNFIEMARIPSPSWHEREMADYCKAHLEGLGFEVVEDGSADRTGCNSGNLIARLPGNGKGNVVFCAHMDTVVPCEGISPERVTVALEGEDGECEIIRSEGDTILSADDKAGIAAIFEGVQTALEEGADRPDIIVLLTTCEEHDLVGASALAHGAVPEGAHCFVLDADGRPGSIIVGAPFHYSLKAFVHGKAAHAGVAPETGVSAIEAAAKAIEGMPLGRISEYTTANIGLIEGGAAINIVAEHCSFEGECRSLHKDEADKQKDAMSAALEKTAEETGCVIDAEWTLDYPGILYDDDSEIVKRLEKAILSCGLEPRKAVSGGGADANVLTEKGIVAITLGIGMTNFHSTTEYIRVQDLVDTARIVKAIIEEYA